MMSGTRAPTVATTAAPTPASVAAVVVVVGAAAAVVVVDPRSGGATPRAAAQAARQAGRRSATETSWSVRPYERSCWTRRSWSVSSGSDGACLCCTGSSPPWCSLLSISSSELRGSEFW